MDQQKIVKLSFQRLNIELSVKYGLDNIVYLKKYFLRCQLVPPEAAEETYERMSPLKKSGVSKISIIAGTFKKIERSAGENKIPPTTINEISK